MLAKYMRCLFQVAISDNVEVAEQLLDQVKDHAYEAQDVSSKPHSYILKAPLTPA